MWLGQYNISSNRIEGSVWLLARLMLLNEESLSLTRFAITPFHYSKYTCYQYVWVKSMLILLNDLELSTYLITDKRWIGGLRNSRTNNTLITSIYLFCVDTWKTTVYVVPRLLSLCLCAPISVDLFIRRIESDYWKTLLSNRPDDMVNMKKIS